MTATYVTNAGAWYALGAGCFLAIAAVAGVLWARHQDGAR